MLTDTEMLNWLEEMAGAGAAPGLINDDNGRWAVSFAGTQEVPDEEEDDFWTCFIVESDEWSGSVREAIQAAYDSWHEEEE